MIFLQIYVILCALVFVLILKGFQNIPDGPQSLLSATLLSLGFSLVWPIMIAGLLIEFKSRGNNE